MLVMCTVENYPGLQHKTGVEERYQNAHYQIHTWKIFLTVKNPRDEEKFKRWKRKIFKSANLTPIVFDIMKQNWS